MFTVHGFAWTGQLCSSGPSFSSRLMALRIRLGMSTRRHLRRGAMGPAGGRGMRCPDRARSNSLLQLFHFEFIDFNEAVLFHHVSPPFCFWDNREPNRSRAGFPDLIKLCPHNSNHSTCSEQPETVKCSVSVAGWPLIGPCECLSPRLCTTEAIPLTPFPSPLGEGGRRPGEGVAADGARVFSVDGVVRCIIGVSSALRERRWSEGPAR